MGLKGLPNDRGLVGAAIGVGPGSADEHSADVRERAGSARNERMERGVPLCEFGIGESERTVEAREGW